MVGSSFTLQPPPPLNIRTAEAPPLTAEGRSILILMVFRWLLMKTVFRLLSNPHRYGIIGHKQLFLAFFSATGAVFQGLCVESDDGSAVQALRHQVLVALCRWEAGGAVWSWKKTPESSIIVSFFCPVVFWKSCLQSFGKPVRQTPLISDLSKLWIFSSETPGQPIWQLSVGTELFLDSNLIYPSWLWGLSAVNMHPWTTCLPASASMMHIKWVLNWELFLLYWKCQSLLPAQLLEVYWQSCTHGSLSASHGLSMQQH